MVNIVHITHTDIKNDWRIRKQLICLNTNSDFEVFGLGIDSFKHLNFPQDGIKSDNVSCIDTNNKLGKIFTTLLASLKILIRLFSVPKIDILHCHDTPALLIGAVFSVFRSKTKIIYDAHELESMKGGQTKLFSAITSLIENICFKRISGFITVSPAILDWYKNKFKFTNAVTILNIPNYSNQEAVESLREKYDIHPAKNIFTHIGLLNKGRGIEEMLEAFKNNKKNHLILFGFGDLEDKIIKYTRENKNIHYFGNVENSKLHSYLIQCDFGLCTLENESLSDYFSLPNKFFEYMNAELTIIGSPLKEISRVIEETQTGYVTDNLKSFLDKANYQKIQYNSPYEYTWEHQVNKLLKFYQSFF